DSARTYRNIHFQSGIRTESSCKTFVTCRRRPIGPSRGRATMIPRQRTIGSRRLGRHDGFDSCREKHQPWSDCCPSSEGPSLGFLAIRCVFWRQDVACWPISRSGTNEQQRFQKNRRSDSIVTNFYFTEPAWRLFKFNKRFCLGDRRRFLI